MSVDTCFNYLYVRREQIDNCWLGSCERRHTTNDRHPIHSICVACTRRFHRWISSLALIVLICFESVFSVAFTKLTTPSVRPSYGEITKNATCVATPISLFSFLPHSGPHTSFLACRSLLSSTSMALSSPLLPVAIDWMKRIIFRIINFHEEEKFSHCLIFFRMSIINLFIFSALPFFRFAYACEILLALHYFPLLSTHNMTPNVSDLITSSNHYFFSALCTRIFGYIKHNVANKRHNAKIYANGCRCDTGRTTRSTCRIEI